MERFFWSLKHGGPSMNASPTWKAAAKCVQVRRIVLCIPCAASDARLQDPPTNTKPITPRPLRRNAPPRRCPKVLGYRTTPPPRAACFRQRESLAVVVGGVQTNYRGDTLSFRQRDSFVVVAGRCRPRQPIPAAVSDNVILLRWLRDCVGGFTASRMICFRQRDSLAVAAGSRSSCSCRTWG